MFAQLLIISVFAFTAVQAKYLPESAKYEKYEEEPEEHYPPTPYHYKYAVEDHKTGDYHSHQEESDGEIVKGEYTVADPDGTIRTVKYTVGKHTGFQAIVITHKGEHDTKEEYYGFPSDFHKPEPSHKPIYEHEGSSRYEQPSYYNNRNNANNYQS